MSEEEKQAIRGLILTYGDDEEFANMVNSCGKILRNKDIANLLDKQQKEIVELKTITNQYQAYKVNGYGKDTIAFASKEYFDNGSFKEAPSIDELEDLQNQIAELKDKLDTKDKAINKMAEDLTTPIHSKEWIIKHYLKG